MNALKKMILLRLFQAEPPTSYVTRRFVLVILIVSSSVCWIINQAKVNGREPFSAESDQKRKVNFLSENCGGCNLFEGEWIWDENYPLYQSKDCKFVDEGFRCSENGRPDTFFTKWRWQPKHCNLPRFNAKIMLEKLRNKRVAFVGDSIGRNQWESLLCLLSSAIPNKDSIYEVNGKRITKRERLLIFKITDYNCTLEYYRAPFLVSYSQRPKGAPSHIRTTLKLDQMDSSSSVWRDADVLVLNTGHWWNNNKTKQQGWYFQLGLEVMTDMDIDTAYRRSLQTALDWIRREVNTSKTQVYFRTFAPSHFRDGDWRNGGNCHSETHPDMVSSLVPSHTWAKYSIFVDVASVRSNMSDFKAIHVLNITHMTSRRKDGHSSLYYMDPSVRLSRASPHIQEDCIHWCLPGVPDSWNELLYALFLKQLASTTQETLLRQI